VWQGHSAASPGACPGLGLWRPMWERPRLRRQRLRQHHAVSPPSHPAQTLVHHSGQLHPARQPAPSSSRTGAAPALAPPSATSPSPALRSPAAGQRQRAGAGAHSAAPQPPPSSACDLALHLASRQQQQPCSHLPAPSAVHSAFGARPLQTTRATTVPTPSRLKASTVEVSNKSTRLKSGGQDT
jgi:hypothetical protein